MLGKNNIRETIRKMEMQSKQDHFSIRKLTIGAASVLLGFTFLGLNNQTVKADTVAPAKEEVNSQSNENQTAKTKQTQDTASTVKQSSQQKQEQDLSTFSGLSSFLKDSSNTSVTSSTDSTTVANSDSKAEDKTDNKTSSNSQAPGQGTSSNDGQDTSATGDNAKTDESQNKVDQIPVLNDQDVKRDATANGAVQVSNWKDFVAAYQNKNVSEIDLTDNITDAPNGDDFGFDGGDISGRKLLIKSIGNTRYKLDFKGYHPHHYGPTSADITYENVSMWSGDYYGVYDTEGVYSNQSVNITFINTDFHGSQMIFAGDNTHIYFYGDNDAETIKTPYFTGGPYDGNDQQLFQFTGQNDSIEFVDGTFNGSTYGGSVIEMTGTNDTITIDKKATVNLQPVKNYDNTHYATGEWGKPFSAVYIGGKCTFDVYGSLNISLGDNSSDYKYKGTLNYSKSRAIFLADGNATFNIQTNGAVNVTTNGNITDADSGNLIFDNGNFNILPQGALNVTGHDMGDYKGTLVLIKGKADVENGAFNISLNGSDSIGNGTGAGSGAITLVDVQGGTLIVNNPTSLVLNAAANKNPATSIIGTMPITITNVRQEFDLSSLNAGLGIVDLPPFHVLKVRKNNGTITVDSIELLNGKTKLTTQTLQDIENKVKDAKIDLSKLPSDVLEALQTAATKGGTFDSLFTDIIQRAFNKQNNFGYNNIKLIPANPSGFIDIDSTKVSVKRNDDGSNTIIGEAGSVLNYDKVKDGPDEDLQHPKNPFSLVMPVATKAYIVANIIDNKGAKTAWSAQDKDNKPVIVSPYINTDDSLRDTTNKTPSLNPLPTQFAAVVNDDGSFSFTIPADQTVKYNKGYFIELSPSANFIGYNPNELNKNGRPVRVSLDILTLSEARDLAAKAINDAINTAKTNKPNNLTTDQNKAFTDAMNKAAAAASKTINNANKATSVYDSSADSITTVNQRRDAALKVIADAVTAAEGSAQIETNRTNAINDLNNEASKQSGYYPSQTQAINVARDNAIQQVNSAKTTDDVNTAKGKGITAIDKVGQDYKSGIRTDINKQITQVKDDIAVTAKDSNLNDTEKAEINGLTDRLKRPEAIAADQGDIDKDSDETSVKAHQKEAQDDIDALKNTISAIKKLQDAAKDEISKHSDKMTDIQDSLNKAVHSVINGDDPDGSKGLEAIKQVYAEQEATNIKNAAAAAKKRVQNSGLSAEDQNKYLTEIDNATQIATAKPGSANYDANKSIYGTTDGAVIKQREAIAQTAFDKAAAKAEVSGYAITEENAFGISSTTDIEKAVSDGIATIDQAADSQTVATAEDTAKKKVLKETSKKKLVDVEADVENQISNISGLTAQNIDDAKKQAQKILSNTTNPLGYEQRVDQANTFDNIDGARNDGITALNNLLTKQQDLGKRNNQLSDAAAQIRQKQQDADNAINNTPNLSDDDRKTYHDQIKKVADDSINGLSNIDTEKIDDAVTTAKGKIDSIVADAQNKGNTVIKKARQEATQVVDDAAKDAKAKIESIPDSQLSQSNKKHFEDQIDQDAQAAKDKIAAAQDQNSIQSAAQDGKNEITRDLNDAQISAARAQAISDLQNAKNNARKTISDAHSSGSLGDNDWQDKLDQIDKAYDQAIQAVSSDLNASDIQNDAENGKKAIQSVVDSLNQNQADLDLAKQRQDAIKQLQTARDAANKQITNDLNLGVTEKNDYYNQINNAFNSAQSAIQSAGKDDVDTALANGTRKLTQIQETASLQSAKDQAINDLLAERNKIKEQIGDMDQVTSAYKNDLRKQADDQYNQAVNNVNSASASSTQQVNQIAKDGKAAIDNVISDTNINKVINKQKLDDYAQKAIDRINNATDISQDTKNKTISGIEAARDQAKADVDSKDKVADANTAEQNGELAIDAAEAKGNDFDSYRNSALSKVNEAANNAISQLGKDYDKLSGDEKNQAQKAYSDAVSAIQQANRDASTNINNATNKEQVDRAYNDAITAINNAHASADLANAKATASTAIKNAAGNAKGKLSNSNDQNAVDAVGKLGLSDVSVANDIETVGKIKDNTLQSIQNVVDNANSTNADAIRDQRNKAIDELDKALNSGGNYIGVDNQIDSLTDLSTDEKNKFKSEAQEAHDRAVAKVDGAAADQIDTEKDTGIVNINQALSDAKLQAAKNKAKSDLDQTAKNAVNNDPTDKDTINNERDKAKNKIDQSDTIDKVNKAKGDGDNAIKGIEKNASDQILANDKASAKNDFESDVDKLQNQIDQDLADKKLGQDQYNDLKDKINQARSDGETRINSATDQTGLNSAKSQNQTDLNKLGTEIAKDESQTSALKQLQDAVNKASAAADEIAKDNPDLAAQMRDRIKAERDKAAQNIESAKSNTQDANNAMSNAAQNGVSAITGLTDRFEKKNTAIDKLKDYAEQAKSSLQGNNLDANEISQGEKDITAALQNGTSNIYSAQDNDNLTEIEAAGEKAIDNAKLPSDLLSEKNKQIAAIDDYVKGKGDLSSVASHLTPDQKSDLQNQLNQVVQNTKDKISQVNLPENAQSSDLANAKQQLANIEKGTAADNTANNSGESGVDKIYDLAKNQEGIYEAKQDAIKALQDAKDQANNNIEHSGLSAADQDTQKQKVQDIFDKSKAEINNIPDKKADGSDRDADDVRKDANQIVDKAKNGYQDSGSGSSMPGFNDITAQAALAGAKTKAENQLKSKQNQAHDIINKSQLTDSEKQDANKAIDDAYNKEKTSIDTINDISKVPQDSTIGKDIDNIWQNSLDWVAKDKQDALKGTNGLQDELNGLTDKQKENQDYQDYIKDINNSIAAINQTTNIKDISSAYNTGITALNKLKAKEDINVAADKAITEINHNPDIGDQTKTELINNVNNHVKEGKTAVDQVNAPSDDPAGKKTNIDKASDTAKNDIQSEVNKAIDQSKKKADQEVADHAKDAIDQIHKQFGDKADTSSIQDTLDKHQHTEGNSYDEIQKNKLEAEKDIAKGAVDDAAKDAKKDVDDNKAKHQDGTDLTDVEKQKIKDDIDHKKDDAKDKIDHSNSGDDIDKNRDDGINNIHHDSSDPSTIDKVINGGDNNGSGSNTGNGENSGNAGGGSAITRVPDQNKQPGNDHNANNSNNNNNDTDVNLNNSSSLELMHNAYLYDETGKRTNQITLGAGSTISTYGTKTINGKEYYVLVDQGANNKKYYVAVGNAQATKQKLTHNAYIYNQLGKRVKKSGVYKKGQLLNTYGSVVKIRGKKYFTIGKNRFVKAANVKMITSSKSASEEVAPTDTNTNEQPVVTVTKSLKHNAYLYNESGKRANKLIFNAGSVVETTGKKTINGQTYYVLPDGLYIASGNIDAKKLKLKHNAYIYNKYGHRLGKKVLKKRKSVKTYGNSVKIGHKKYYTLSKGRFVKKANF